MITKNWFIHKTKKNARSIKREVHFDDLTSDLECEFMSIENHYMQMREQQEFWNNFWYEVKNWEKMKLKENERKVLEAIKILFETSDQIEIFNKKAIYLYIREITGLNTKQVVNNLNKMRVRYRIFKRKWTRGDI